MASSLIDGKHYKQVVIEYYDDLIAQMDVHAEEQIEKFKNDSEFNVYENKKVLKQILDTYNYEEFFQQIFEKLKDPYRSQYRFENEEPLVTPPPDKTFHDFVHAERMRGINEMKLLQKNRLEEIKLAKTKPTSIEEAIFGGNKFGFLLEINESKFVEMRMKFRLMAVVVDFYLDKDQIKQIQNQIAQLDLKCNNVMNINSEIFQEKFLHIHLLVRYLHDQIVNNPNGECVKCVTKNKLYLIEKIDLILKPRQLIPVFEFSDSIDFTRLKSLSLNCWSRKRIERLNLSGLTNMECLELVGFEFDLKQNDPFVNMEANKLRQLRLSDCDITNAEINFYSRFSNLEILDYNNFYKYHFLPLKSLSYLNNLKHLSLYSKLESLDFLKEMIHLVTFKLNLNSDFDSPIVEETFKELRNLENLSIRAKKGKWMRYLDNLKSLELRDRGSEDEDVNYFDYLTNLQTLGIWNESSTRKQNVFNGLKQLKCLSLASLFQFENFVKTFEDFDLLDELEIILIWRKFSLNSGSFKKLQNLRKLSIKGNGNLIDDADFLRNFPNLTCLKLESIRMMDIKFSELRNLEKLVILDCNLFSSLPDNVFMGLSKLSELHLCGISTYTLTNANAFNGLGNLSEFRFWSNIESAIVIEFDMNILSRMPKLKQIVLDDRMRESVDTYLMKTKFPNLKYIHFFA